MIRSAHELKIEAQPIADQLMVKCSCGWRKTVSCWDFEYPSDWAEAHRLMEAHVEFHR